MQPLIKKFVENYPNTHNVSTIWKEPLVAYADAHDEMFPMLKNIVSPSHAIPQACCIHSRFGEIWFEQYVDYGKRLLWKDRNFCN